MFEAHFSDSGGISPEELPKNPFHSIIIPGLPFFLSPIPSCCPAVCLTVQKTNNANKRYTGIFYACSR